MRIERLLLLVRVGHGGCVGADDGGVSVFSQLESHRHEATIVPSRDEVKLGDQVIFNCKSDSCLAFGICRLSNPEKGVAGSELSELALVGESRFGKFCEVDFVFRMKSSNYR